MPDRDYTINYNAPPGKAVRGIDAMEARLVKFEATIVKTQSLLKGLGSDVSGLAKFATALASIAASLGSLQAAAGQAAAGLKGVGQGNSAVSGLTKRVAALTAQIAALQAAAASAAPVVAGVGAGGPRAGGGAGAGGAKPVGRGLASGIGMAMTRHAGMMAARKTLGAVGDMAGERRSFFSEAADMATDFRKDLKGLAILKDVPADKMDGLMREQFAFMKATGLNADEANELRTEFGGAIAPGLTKKNITPEVADDLEKQAAKFALRYDLDMKSAGRLAGLLPNYGKVPTAAAGVGALAQGAEQLNVFGLGTPKSMLPSLIGLSADMLSSEEGGRFKDFPSQAARFGNTTFQAKSPSAAGTQIRQANRLLRKAAVSGQYGITTADDYETSLRKIEPYITGPNGDIALTDAGFRNSTERDSVIKQAKMNAVVDEQLKDPRMRAANANAIRDNDAFAGTLPGQAAAAENDEFIATVTAGMAGEKLKVARASARAHMIGDDRLKAGFGTKMGDLVRMGSTFGGISGEDIRVDTEAIRKLSEEGAKVGVDVPGRFPGLSTLNRIQTVQDEAGLAAEFGRASDAVDAARKLRAAADAIEKIGAGGEQRRRPGPPEPGDAAAGFNPNRR